MIPLTLLINIGIRHNPRGDAQIGQLMNPWTFNKTEKNLPAKSWALTGAEGRKKNVVKSFYPVKGQLEEFNAHLQKNTGQLKNMKSGMRLSISIKPT